MRMRVRAWFEVDPDIGTEYEKVHPKPLQLPLEVAEYPGGWLCWLNSLGIRKSVDDFIDSEEGQAPSAIWMEVEDVPRLPYSQAARSWFSAPSKRVGVGHSDSKPHEAYEPIQEVPAIAGRIMSGRAPTPLPVLWQPRHTESEMLVEADPDDLDELLAVFPDVEEEEMTEPRPGTVGPVFADADENAYQRVLEERRAMFDGRRIVVTNAASALYGRELDVLDVQAANGELLVRTPAGFRGRVKIADVELAETQPAPEPEREPEPSGAGVEPETVSQVPPDELAPAQEPAPRVITEISEVLEVKATTAPLNGHTKIEVKPADLSSWKRTELPELRDMIKQGYNPETHWRFRGLSDEQRKLLKI